MTADLAAWLLADDGPIAEDERMQSEAWHSQTHQAGCGHDMAEFDSECYCGGPARVLAECAAKRAIVEAYVEEQSGYTDESLGLDIAVCALAQPYAGRPGWREEWSAAG